MNRKLILILCDGMRSDSLEACGHPMATWMQEHSLHTLQARTVMPSITLPCIMSLCYSAQPERHGIFTLQYAQPLKPVEGIFEHLARHGKQCTFYYDWEELSLPPRCSRRRNAHSQCFSVRRPVRLFPMRCGEHGNNAARHGAIPAGFCVSLSWRSGSSGPHGRLDVPPISGLREQMLGSDRSSPHPARQCVHSACNR